MKRLKSIPFSVQLFAGLFLGVALGWVARNWAVTWLGESLTTIGSLFVQLLFLVVPVLVFTAIVAAVGNLRNLANAGRLVMKTLGWFMITSLVAVAVAIGLGLAMNPGKGVDLSSLGAAEAPESQGSWIDFITGVLPTNVMTAFSEVNVLQIVFLAIVVGAAAVKVGEKAEAFLKFNTSLLEITQKALWWVIRLAPIGTAGLIGRAVYSYGWDLLAPLAKFSAAIYIGCFIVLLVIYPLVLRLFGRVSPIMWLRKAWPALQFAFASRSSVGTMPLAQRTVTDRMGVDRNYAAFASPFAATTKMDGCAAIYPAIAAIFVAEVFGLNLGVGDYLLIAFVSVVGSAATAGLTGAIVMLTLTLSTLGLPLEGVGLLLAIDPILDMIRTATNVAGQMVVPVVVARSEKLLDDEVFNAPPQPLDEPTAVESDVEEESAEDSGREKDLVGASSGS